MSAYPSGVPDHTATPAYVLLHRLTSCRSCLEDFNEGFLDTYRATDGDCWRTCPNDPGVSCGGWARASFFKRNPPLVPATAPLLGFTYKGCYTDNGGNRALPFRQGSRLMTPALCDSLCPETRFVGLQYGSECWCGPTLGAGSEKVADAECKMPCAGSHAAFCGSGLRFTLYEREVDPFANPPSGPAVSGYNPLGW